MQRIIREQNNKKRTFEDLKQLIGDIPDVVKEFLPFLKKRMMEQSCLIVCDTIPSCWCCDLMNFCYLNNLKYNSSVDEIVCTCSATFPLTNFEETGNLEQILVDHCHSHEKKM